MGDPSIGLSPIRLAEPLGYDAPYQVVARERVAPTIVELSLPALAEVLDYLLGEYVLLEDDDHLVRRGPTRSPTRRGRTRRSRCWSRGPRRDNERLGRRRELTLIFSARCEADVIDHDQFAAWQATHAGFRFIRTLTRGAGPPPHGRIPALLASLCPPLTDRDVFIAGVPGFVRACAAAGDALGAAPARIHTEVFFVEPQPWTDAAPQVEVRE